MTKAWKHEVSIDWLNARRDVLTASEIKAMLPEYKRVEKRLLPSGKMRPGDISPGFVALAYEKLSKRELDPVSIGAAARGHIMEPYAVEEWNAWWPENQMYHWDDIIIKHNGLGFSPDGLNVPQDVNMGIQVAWSEKNKCLVVQNETFKAPTQMLEVKCYEPKQHAKAIIAAESGKDIDERWQVAVAFMVLHSLTHAYIMWYCPDSPIPMYCHVYNREDLEKEIKIITNMVRIFHYSMDYVKNTMLKCVFNDKPIFTEEAIYQEYCSLQSDNVLKI